MHLCIHRVFIFITTAWWHKPESFRIQSYAWSIHARHFYPLCFSLVQCQLWCVSCRLACAQGPLSLRPIAAVFCWHETCEKPLILQAIVGSIAIALFDFDNSGGLRRWQLHRFTEVSCRRQWQRNWWRQCYCQRRRDCLRAVIMWTTCI